MNRRLFISKVVGAVAAARFSMFLPGCLVEADDADWVPIRGDEEIVRTFMHDPRVPPGTLYGFQPQDLARLAGRPPYE